MHLVKDGRILIEVELADTSSKRMLGLMFQKNIDKGMLLMPNNNIHTFFMKEPIDVAYLDKHNKVVKLTHSMKPWRVGPIVLKARKTLELPSGFLKNHCIEPGEMLEFK